MIKFMAEKVGWETTVLCGINAVTATNNKDAPEKIYYGFCETSLKEI